MIYYRPEGLHSQRSLAYRGVAVLVRSRGILAVVDVNGSQTFQANDGIEMFQYSVKIKADYEKTEKINTAALQDCCVYCA